MKQLIHGLRRRNKMKKLFILLCAFFFYQLSSIPISFNQAAITFDNAIANQDYIQSLRIYNDNNISQEITILHQNKAFSLSDTLFTLAPNDSIDIQVVFNGKHNIAYKDIFYFLNSDNQTPSFLKANIPVNYTEDLYLSTYNKWDSELRNEIFNLINNHTSLGYTGARQAMFGSIDNVDGWVECVYTGRMVETNTIPDVNTTHMNTEHTWPQSKGAAGVAKSDLYHLYPVDEYANNIRGNLPFGNVTNGQNWENSGSKRGYDDNSVLVFEPRDIHKGNVARAMIYFAIRYDNPFAPFFDIQEDTLKEWNKQYPVTEIEAQRNNAIAALQHKRNPFIDHPEFVERLYSIANPTDRPQIATYFFPLTDINAYYGENISIPIANFGNAALQINSVVPNNNLCSVIDYPNLIEPYDCGTININISAIAGETSSVISINSSTGVYQITINYQETAVDINILKPQYFQVAIYPNPISSIANIEITSNKETLEPIFISAYNIKGQKIDSWSYKNAKKADIVFDQSKYSNGIYFLKIKQAEQEQIKKIIIIK